MHKKCIVLFYILIVRFWFSTAKWDNTPKDVLILHSLPRGKCIPSPSPFVLKLETYFRMADIPYQVNPFKGIYQNSFTYFP